MVSKLVFEKDRFHVNLVSMQEQIIGVIRQKIADDLETPFTALTRREARLPEVPGKVHAITGMRRAGKTCFLKQCLANAAADGVARERLVYFNFEDDRLGDMVSGLPDAVVESYFARFPEFRRREKVWFCFDEIQLVPQWERFVRRLLDTEKTRAFISGSSAKMLSREVASSMRGRALETVITPFSFREFLAARGGPAPLNVNSSPSARTVSWLKKFFADYLATGGFPEALTVTREEDRVALLQSYAEVVLFRDVAERHGVGNLPALRAFMRQMLRHPATLFSVSKIAKDFHSRGIAASKETLLAFLDYFTDAFMVLTVPVFAESERKRQVNPRKLYLADHSLAVAFSPATGLNRGRMLENMVACELARSARDLTYYKTADGLEVDFLVTDFYGQRQLIQVTADVSPNDTLAREIRALMAAAQEQPDAESWLLCENLPPADGDLPKNIRVLPLWRWLAQDQPFQSTCSGR
jgi:predicted AAA+ superfamily ATPase